MLVRFRHSQQNDFSKHCSPCHSASKNAQYSFREFFRRVKSLSSGLCVKYSNFISNPKFSKSIILMLVFRMHNSRFSFNEKLEPKHCCAAAHACILIKHENFLLNCNLNQIRLSTSHSSSAEHVFAEKIPSLPATIFPGYTLHCSRNIQDHQAAPKEQQL